MLKNAKSKLAIILIITGLVGILSIGIITIIMLKTINIENSSEIISKNILLLI